MTRRPAGGATHVDAQSRCTRDEIERRELRRQDELDELRLARAEDLRERLRTLENPRAGFPKEPETFELTLCARHRLACRRIANDLSVALDRPRLGCRRRLDPLFAVAKLEEAFEALDRARELDACGLDALDVGDETVGAVDSPEAETLERLHTFGEKLVETLGRDRAQVFLLKLFEHRTADTCEKRVKRAVVILNPRSDRRDQRDVAEEALFAVRR